MKRFFKRSIIATSFFAATCWGAPVSSTVEGQIFVVTKGQQAIKLALVDVFAVDEKNLKASIQGRIQVAVAESSAIAESIERKKLELIALKSALKDSEGNSPVDELEQLSNVCKATPDVDAFLRCSRTDIGKAAFDRTKVLNEQYKNSLAPINAIRRELRPLMKQHRDVISSLRSHLTTAKLSGKYISQAKTDADGKFSLPALPVQRIAILADSQRAVGDTTETYQWIVWLTPKRGVKNNLILANDNLLETGCSTCFQLSNMKTYPDVNGFPEYISASHTPK